MSLDSLKPKALLYDANGVPIYSGPGSATNALRVVSSDNDPSLSRLRYTLKEQLELLRLELGEILSEIPKGGDTPIQQSASHKTGSVGTSVVFTIVGVEVKVGVRVLSDPTNNGIIYAGSSSVTSGTSAPTDGYPLYAGDSLFLPVKTLNLIASVSSQIFHWIAV